VAGLVARLGADVRINVRPVAAIPAEASGKYRYVVSHVPVPHVSALETLVA
jgi:phenylacetate-CoA ligase